MREQNRKDQKAYRQRQKVKREAQRNAEAIQSGQALINEEVLFMIGVAFIAWLDGQLKAIEALGIIALNAVLGFFLGLRPLWNQFTPPRR